MPYVSRVALVFRVQGKIWERISAMKKDSSITLDPVRATATQFGSAAIGNDADHVSGGQSSR